MRPQSELMARSYERLRVCRETGKMVNDRAVASELAREVPDSGISENELAEMVAKYAANYGVPVELSETATFH